MCDLAREVFLGHPVDVACIVIFYMDKNKTKQRNNSIQLTDDLV